MMYGIDKNNKRILPSPKEEAFCELCKSKLISKCGDIRIWYWSHYRRPDCDNWYEPETQWHYEWKNLAPKNNREIVIPPHRADIKGTRGIIVELQNSPISTKDIRNRETFYKNMVWIINAQNFDIELDTNIYEEKWKKNKEIRFYWKRMRKTWNVSNLPNFFD